MKKLFVAIASFLSLIVLCLPCISCHSGGKESANINDSIVGDGNNEYIIEKFVISSTSNELIIYKAPSKDSLIVVFVEEDPNSADANPDGPGGWLEWGTKSQGKPSTKNVLPVIGEIGNWYKVYANFELFNYSAEFIGYVPKDESVVSAITPVKAEDTCELYWEENIYSIPNSNYYLKWGSIECEGPALVIGKIENGYALETNQIYYNVDTDASKILMYDSNDVSLEISNPKYLVKKTEWETDVDYSKFTQEDANKLISTYGKTIPNMLVKLEGINELCRFPIGQTKEGWTLNIKLK